MERVVVVDMMPMVGGAYAYANKPSMRILVNENERLVSTKKRLKRKLKREDHSTESQNRKKSRKAENPNLSRRETTAEQAGAWPDF